MSHAIYCGLMKRDAAKRLPGAGNILMLWMAFAREQRPPTLKAQMFGA